MIEFTLQNGSVQMKIEFPRNFFLIKILQTFEE